MSFIEGIISIIIVLIFIIVFIVLVFIIVVIISLLLLLWWRQPKRSASSEMTSTMNLKATRSHEDTTESTQVKSLQQNRPSCAAPRRKQQLASLRAVLGQEKQ